MRYLVDLIKDKNPEATIEFTVSFLMKEGYLSYTVQYHFEIYEFFKKCSDHYKEIGLSNKAAIADTCEHFKTSERTLYRIRKAFDKTMAE
jgi:hypothetical protein